jgi:uncharacterized protein (TIGR02217 family)
MASFSSFHDVLFPVPVSFGATGGPEHATEIVRMTSGAEKRNARFSASRRRYDAGTGLTSLDDLHEVMAFFEARRGKLHAFRFRDPFDMKSCRPGENPGPIDQRIGTDDGIRASFPLLKVYGAGEDACLRPITKPVAGSVMVAIGGLPRVEGSDYSVDALSGLLTFSPSAIPPAGAAVTAGFLFDVPVRFDTDRIAASLSTFSAGRIPAIPLVEVAQ